MTSPIVSKLLEQRLASEALAEFESDFSPSSVGLWEMAQNKATDKFGHFPSAESLDYAFGWYNLKEGYWNTDISEEVLDEGTLHHWFKGSKSKDGKPGWVQADGSPCANEEGEDKTPKCFSSGRLAALKRKGKKGENKIKSAVRRKREEDPNQQQKSGGAKPTNVKTFAKGKKDKDYVEAEPKLKKEEVEIQEKKDIKGKGSGSKDACYHKVKARFKVFPSAYASGALVQCRKKGAANWGTKTKKEGYEPGVVDQKVGAVTPIPKDEREAARQRILAKALAAKKKREMKKEDTSDSYEVDLASQQRIEDLKQQKIAELAAMKESKLDEERIPPQNGNMLMVMFNWRGKLLGMKVFFPETKMPTRSEIQEALDKVYPGCVVRHYTRTPVQPQEPYINVGIGGFAEENEVSEDWQKVNKSDRTDGMSKKAVAAYRRENPGSKLKTAVTGNPKRGSKDAKRRKSYCSRSAGQQKMHNIDCSKTPDKAICKARRRWKC